MLVTSSFWLFHLHINYYCARSNTDRDLQLFHSSCWLLLFSIHCARGSPSLCTLVWSASLVFLKIHNNAGVSLLAILLCVFRGVPLTLFAHLSWSSFLMFCLMKVVNFLPSTPLMYCMLYSWFWLRLFLFLLLAFHAFFPLLGLYSIRLADWWFIPTRRKSLANTAFKAFCK